MGLFVCRIYEWRDIRDSSNRIHASETATGRDFILNTNRVSDITAVTNHPYAQCKFFYSENPGSRREGLSEIWTSDSVADVSDYFDDVPGSNAVTLPICRYNSPYKGNPVFPLGDIVNTTVGLYSIAIVDRYNPAPNDYVWITYYKGSFKRMEVLCSIHSDLYPNLTTTTTSTTTRGDQL